MNVPLLTLLRHPWVERLGWTLVHFLWQGLAIAVLYAGARLLARRSSPNARYLLACAALAAMMAAPLATWGLMGAPDGAADATCRIRNTPPATFTGGLAATALPASLCATVSGAPPAQFLFWAVMIWLAGAVGLAARLAAGCLAAARMRETLVRRAPPEWQETLGRLGARIGLSRPVRLLVSALVEVPAVVGWLRPVVLVPVGALGGLPPGQLEAILVHELAHIRRHDYLVNMLQSAVEALLFYHPAVWWVSGHIRAERELCCDDVAVSASGDALAYAHALARLESYRPASLHAAVAASGGSLAARIARLLGQPRPAVRGGLGPGVLAAALLLVAAAWVFGQPDAHPAFQAASIRRNATDWNERGRHSMGLGVNSSLKLLIQFVYADHSSPYAGHWMPLLASQIVGGPDWIDSERYDIETTPGADTDQKQLWLMWQKLLADRFHLRLHGETRDLPVYVLTAAANGFKLPPPEDVGCVSFPAGTRPHPVPGKFDCGYVSGPFAGHNGGLLHIDGRKVRMADFIRELAFVLDRPVVDKTGFSGEFDLDLRYARDDIFAAIEEQLGLKVTPANGPVDVLVVDHAERPAAK
jgi:uncharacterized protein (TIGR03435 family)